MAVGLCQRLRAVSVSTVAAAALIVRGTYLAAGQICHVAYSVITNQRRSRSEVRDSSSQRQRRRVSGRAAAVVECSVKSIDSELA
jgi:hypothetical protein